MQGNEEHFMRLGMIGLGKMGGNMARRLRAGGIDVVGHDHNPEQAGALEDECGLVAAASLEQLVQALEAPRIVWMMLPAGEVTEAVVLSLTALLDAGDTIVDGGNANFNDSMRRGEMLAKQSLDFVDAGVSGGVWGITEGYAMMLGGQESTIARLRPVLEVLAPGADEGWLHTGPVGSGHFVKMVHNGIEYGMMQAYAEGFALMQAREDFGLDLAAIAESWRHGSVVRSWLLDLTAEFLERDQALDDTAPFVSDSGEGRWTAIEAIEQGVPTPVMSAALMARFASQGRQDYTAKLLAKMRQAFGGHEVQSVEE
ncbi:MAG: phosphogluconate dehydrogenase (NAD(+)-dependent, decarboxylating) [Pseudomonadota bacterium]